MSVITDASMNIWEEICKEALAQKPVLLDDEKDETASIDTQKAEYNAAQHHPAFCGLMHSLVNVDANVAEEFDPAVCHPATVGYTLLDKPSPQPDDIPAPLPDKKTCLPTDYLKHYVFPWLLPIMQAMLHEAKENKCFEKRRTKFNVMDFFTEHLFVKNRRITDGSRDHMHLEDIPFVRKHLKQFPRRPLPMSLIWTDEEAAIVIQSFWRGHVVRRTAEVQELRVWQREWREETEDIHEKIEHFWAKKMPDKKPSVDTLTSHSLVLSYGKPGEETYSTNTEEEESISIGNDDSHGSTANAVV